MSDSIRDQTIAFIAEKLNLDAASINESTYFYTDLGISSMKAMELVCDVEERFNFEIPDEDLGLLHKVGDFINYIKKLRR
jgi:acyl carrier protein